MSGGAVRVLVTGAGGQLGGDVVEVAPELDVEAAGFDRSALDITDAAAVASALDSVRPAAVINCAGWTDVDGAEEQRDAAFAVNAEGPRILARATHERGVRLVHVSTDYVFDGHANAPIAEDAPTSPRSAYGASKLAGEQAVRETTDMHAIVRTSWLFGRDGPNFVLTMLRLGAGREEVRVVDDQRGSPTWTRHLAPALLRLALRGARGTYHVTNSGDITWRGFAGAIFETAHLSCRAVPITTEEFGARAPRPRYSVLDNRAWLALGEQPLPSWQEALTGYLAMRGVTQARR